jgi:uncharacterized protein
MATLTELGVAALRETVERFASALHAHQVRLNRLNVFPVPDGDTGTNMARTAAAVAAEISKVEPTDLRATAGAIRLGSLMGARGNSGVILSQILRGLAETVAEAERIGGETVAAALRAASSAAYAAVLTPVEGTILTVVREASAAADLAASEGASLDDVLRRAREAGRAALERSPDLLPALREAGVVDAGGAGFLLLLDAALSVVTGEPLPVAGEADDDRPETIVDVGADRYEVMLLLRNSSAAAVDAMTARWSEVGGSIVVVGSEADGVWNCHVHTGSIGSVIEAAIDAGRPTDIRVTDLAEEVAHRETLWPTDHIATIAVGAGRGIARVLSTAGADRVVAGGQSDNPCTADIVAAIEATGCQTVVVLPSNKNVVPVARQAAQVTETRDRQVRVSVVATRSVPQTLAALAALDRRADLADAVEAMTVASAAVITGEVAPAVRAASTPVGPVREGDWLGIIDGAIAIAGSTQAEVAARIATLVSAVVVFCGADAEDAAIDAVRAARPDASVIDGGQPVYAFTMSSQA